MVSRVSRRHMLSAGLGAGALLALPDVLRAETAGQLALAPTKEDRIVFEILRNGGKIGEHAVTFTPGDADALRVTTDIAISVSVLGITAYRYEQAVEEVWRDDRLMSLSSRTNDDGTRKTVEGARNGAAFEVVDKDGESRSLSGPVLTTSLWHRRTPYVSKLVGIEDGGIRKVTSESLGRETLRMGGGSLDTEHYRLTGDFTRDLWYDSRDRLVQAGFNTKRDGSRIELQAVDLTG